MRIVLLVVVASVVMSSVAYTQSSNSGYLFQRPNASVVLRAGYAGASANSDLFAFTSRQLTLDRSDYGGGTLDLEFARGIGSRTDLVLSTAFAGMSRQSEFRDFLDQNDAPIEQRTTFLRVPITVSVRQYLFSQGRQIGNYAWIPARVAPYVGAGGGAVWYRFRQTGDFVDFQTDDVFPATMSSSGLAPSARAFAGAEFKVRPKLALSVQSSYLWASAKLGNDFSGFDRIDLSGFSASLGLAARF